MSLNTEWVWFTAGIFPVSVWCLLYKIQLLARRHLITFPMLTSRADVSQMRSAPSFTTGFLCDIREIIWSHCTVSPSVKQLPEPSPTPLWSLGYEHMWEYCVRGMSENLWCSVPPPLTIMYLSMGGSEADVAFLVAEAAFDFFVFLCPSVSP